MDKTLLLSYKRHQDYERVIDELISKSFDEDIMNEAIKSSKNESQAEALYVLLKLKNQQK